MDSRLGRPARRTSSTRRAACPAGVAGRDGPVPVDPQAPSSRSRGRARPLAARGSMGPRVRGPGRRGPRAPGAAGPAGSGLDSSRRDLPADAPVVGTVEIQHRLGRHLLGGGLDIVERRIDEAVAERCPVVAERRGEVGGIPERILDVEFVIE